MTKKPPLCVLQVLPRFSLGGVERGTLDVAKEIIASNGKAFVASQGGTLEQELSHCGGEHITLPLASKNPFTIIRNAFCLKKVIKKYGINLVHARSRSPAWSAYFACKMTGVPLATTFHGAYGLKPFIKKYYNKVMVKGERVIAVSRFIYDHVLEHYDDGTLKDRLVLIERGVDEKQFCFDAIHDDQVQELRQKHNINKHQKVLFMPGRMTAIKGHVLVLKALAALNNPNIVLVVLGADFKRDHTVYRHLQERAKALNIEGSLRILPADHNIAPYYKMADVVLNATLKPESFGRTIMEGLLMGCVVVASNHGGAKELLEESQNGFLFEPANVHDLAKKIDLALHQAKQERAFEIKDNYLLKTMLAKTMQLYQALV